MKRLLLGLGLLLFCETFVSAHTVQMEPTIALLRIRRHQIRAEFSGFALDLKQFRLLGDREIQGETIIESALQRVGRYFNERFWLRIEGRRVSGKPVAFAYKRSPAGASNDRYTLQMEYTLPKPPRELEVQSLLFSELKGSATIVVLLGTGPTTSFTLDARRPKIRLNTSAFLRNLWQNLLQFAVMGVEHLFTGYDHILFILGLVFGSLGFWPLVKVLTGFTVAHSITLILAALNVVSPPQVWVERFIALSIAYIGVENILIEVPRQRWLIAGLFGLIHGFGFAGVLREMGLPEEGLVWCLLSFNLGLEVAQILLVSALYPWLVFWRRYRANQKEGWRLWRRDIQVASGVTAGIGMFWFIQRLFS